MLTLGLKRLLWPPSASFPSFSKTFCNISFKKSLIPNICQVRTSPQYMFRFLATSLLTKPKGSRNSIKRASNENGFTYSTIHVMFFTYQLFEGNLCRPACRPVFLCSVPCSSTFLRCLWHHSWTLRWKGLSLFEWCWGCVSPAPP